MPTNRPVDPKERLFDTIGINAMKRCQALAEKNHGMIYPHGDRAARSLLDMNQSELATRANLGVATVKRIEASNESMHVTVQTLLRLQRALEIAGIIFIPEDETGGPGVRLKKPSKKSADKSRFARRRD